MAKSRRAAREAATRCLYEIEIGGTKSDDAINEAMMHARLRPEIEAYSEGLARGVLERKDEIDTLLRTTITEYDLDRVAAIDRNVLRVAVYELYNRPEIPPAVSIDEAIEIARKYSTLESGKFVNGVLGRILKDSPKAEWDRSAAPSEFEPEEEDAEPEEEIEIEEIEVEAESPEAKTAQRHGWVLRADVRVDHENGMPK